VSMYYTDNRLLQSPPVPSSPRQTRPSTHLPKPMLHNPRLHQPWPIMHHQPRLHRQPDLLGAPRHHFLVIRRHRFWQLCLPALDLGDGGDDVVRVDDAVVEALAAVCRGISGVGLSLWDLGIL